MNENKDNKTFIDIGLRPDSATPPEEDRATVTGHLHKKFREDRSSASGSAGTSVD